MVYKVIGIFAGDKFSLENGEDLGTYQGFNQLEVQLKSNRNYRDIFEGPYKVIKTGEEVESTHTYEGEGIIQVRENTITGDRIYIYRV